jgi:hypothetical protein
MTAVYISFSISLEKHYMLTDTDRYMVSNHGKN